MAISFVTANSPEVMLFKGAVNSQDDLAKLVGVITGDIYQVIDLAEFFMFISPNWVSIGGGGSGPIPGTYAKIDGPYSSTSLIPKPYDVETAYSVSTGVTGSNSVEIYNVYFADSSGNLHQVGGIDINGYTKQEVDAKDQDTYSRAFTVAINNGNLMLQNAEDYADEYKVEKYTDIIDADVSTSLWYIITGFGDITNFSMMLPNPIDAQVSGDNASLDLLTINSSAKLTVEIIDGTFNLYYVDENNVRTDFYSGGSLIPLVESYQFVPKADSNDDDCTITNSNDPSDISIGGIWADQIQFLHQVPQEGEVTIKYLYQKKADLKYVDAQDETVLQNAKNYADSIHVAVDNKTVFGDGVTTPLTSPRQGLQKSGPYATTDDIPTPYSDLLIYIVGDVSPYAEYMVVDNTLVEVGSTEIDLHNYYTKDQIDQQESLNVKLTGDQTITGKKSFSDLRVSGTPTYGDSVPNRDYVNSRTTFSTYLQKPVSSSVVQMSNGNPLGNAKFGALTVGDNTFFDSSLGMNLNKITNLADGESSNDAVNKEQLDSTLNEAKAYADGLLPFQDEGWTLIYSGQADSTTFTYELTRPITEFDEILVCAAEGKYHSGTATAILPVAGYNAGGSPGDLGNSWNKVDLVITASPTESFGVQLLFDTASTFRPIVSDSQQYVTAIFGKKAYSGGGSGSGGIEEAPIDGNIYGRRNGVWTEIAINGSETKPDYANQEDINRISVNGGSWTVEKDGYVNCYGMVTTNGTMQVFINNQRVSLFGAPINNQWGCVLPVSAGDVVMITFDVGFTSCSCKFIPPINNESPLDAKADKFSTAGYAYTTFYDVKVGDVINEIRMPERLTNQPFATQYGVYTILTFSDSETDDAHGIYLNYQDGYSQIYFLDGRTSENTYFFDTSIGAASLIVQFDFPDYVGPVTWTATDGTPAAGSTWANGFLLVKFLFPQTVMNLRDVYVSCPFPVNSVFMTMSGVDPSIYWPGTTWEKLASGNYVKVAGDESAGTTGGQASISLMSDNLPEHEHIVPEHNHIANNHFHNLYAGWGTGSSADAISAGPIGNVAYKPAGNGGVNFVQSSGVGIQNKEEFETDVNTTTGSNIDIAPPYLAINMYKRLS